MDELIIMVNTQLIDLKFYHLILLIIVSYGYK